MSIDGFSRFRWPAVVMVLALAVAACATTGGGDTTTTTAATTTTTTEAVSDTTAPPDGRPELPGATIGIMGPVDAAEIIKLGTDAVDEAATFLGWETIRVDPGGDPAQMASGMMSLVNSGVDAIVLVTIEPGVVQEGLEAAEEAGILVFNSLTVTESSELIEGEYFVPPEEENALLADRMAQDLPPGSRIGTINLPQFLNAAVAGELIVDLAEENGWEIVASHDADLTNLVADTQQAVGDMIRANPDIDAIWGCCDFVPTGAVPAIRDAGVDIRVYALHGIPSVIPLVEEGFAIVEIADYQKGGIIAIDQLARFWTEGTPIDRDTPEEFAFEMVTVDQSNVDGYPYPTEAVMAPFEERWEEMYDLGG